MKLFQRKQRTKGQKRTPDPMLLHEIEQVKLEMENAYANFQNEIDPDLIDCYIFESNAALKRYHFLLKQAKLMQKCL